jgi:hypothetical protein
MVTSQVCIVSDVDICMWMETGGKACKEAKFGREGVQHCVGRFAAPRILEGMVLHLLKPGPQLAPVKGASHHSVMVHVSHLLFGCP